MSRLGLSIFFSTFNTSLFSVGIGTEVSYDQSTEDLVKNRLSTVALVSTIFPLNSIPSTVSKYSAISSPLLFKNKLLVNTELIAGNDNSALLPAPKTIGLQSMIVLF